MVENWRLLKLGALPALESQMIYEAVAIARDKGLVQDTIILCWPKDPVVCLGFHQEVEKEIDLEYCRRMNLPIVRRILGGGAVYLDAGQLFYQIIAAETNPNIPKTIQKLFEKLLEAPIRTYQEIGIPVEYKPINDIQVRGQKISGNGVGKVGNVNILTGNLILDFNFEEMVKILKVPSEKFRDKVASTLRERLTTISNELGFVPEKELLIQSLKRNFEIILNAPLIEGALTEDEKIILDELRSRYTSSDWIFQTSQRRADLIKKSKEITSSERILKIAGGVFVCEGMFKAPGGLIRVTLKVIDGRIEDILISGDFEFFPKEKLAELESALVGLCVEETVLNEQIDLFYKDNAVQSPGTTPTDFTKTILLATQ